MKTALLVLAFTAANVIAAHSQQVFNNTSLTRTDNRSSISFTLNKEVNTRFFRVEASNDMQNFEVIGCIASKGNSMLPRQYAYEIPDAAYKYYRIGRVSMNADLQYSPVLSAQQTEIKPIQQNIVPGTITQR